MSLLADFDLLEMLDVRELVPATREDLMLAHTEKFIDRVEELAKNGGRLTLDTPANLDVLEIQKLIAGSGLQAAELLLKSDVASAHTFGGLHHAGADYGEGFCLLNDVAIVGKGLVDRHGLDRVMIVDTDAHQGNGTMDIFYDDPRVLFVSIHQDPRTLYPGRGFVFDKGSGNGLGFTVNIPMPPYAGNAQYERAMNEIFMPLARQFKPQMIIRNGGSDPYLGDELTILGLDYEGLAMLNGKVREASDEGCKKLLDMCVSGYGEYVIEGWLAIFAGIEKLDVDLGSLESPGDSAHRGYPEEMLDAMTNDMLAILKDELKEFWDF